MMVASCRSSGDQHNHRRSFPFEGGQNVWLVAVSRNHTWHVRSRSVYPFEMLKFFQERFKCFVSASADVPGQLAPNLDSLHVRSCLCNPDRSRCCYCGSSKLLQELPASLRFKFSNAVLSLALICSLHASNSSLGANGTWT